MRVKSIRKELQLLRLYALCTTILAGIFLLGAIHEGTRNATFDTITVHQIRIVDREGKPAMILTNHDDPVQPVWAGHTLKRGGGSDVNGIVMYNRLGNEQGAFIWNGLHKNGVYESANTLSYDTTTTDQLLQVDDGSYNGQAYSYVTGWNRLNIMTPQAIKAMQELQNAKNAKAAAAIVAKYPNVFYSARRYLFGYDQTNDAQVMLADGKGNPRIKMFVTPKGESKLQFLDASGKIVAQYPH